MKKKTPVKKNELVAVVLSALVVLLAASGLLVSFSLQISDLLLENTYSSLNELAALNCKTFVAELKHEQELLGMSAKMLNTLEAQNFTDMNKMPAFLNAAIKRPRFSRLIFCNSKGEAISNLGERSFIGDRDYFLRSLAGEEVISPLIVSRISGENCLVLSMPLISDEKIVGTLHGSLYPDSLKSFFSENETGGDSYGYIIAPDGNFVLNSTFEEQLLDENNVLDFLRKVRFDRGYSYKKFLETMQRGKTGVFGFTYQGSHRYVSFIPVGINGWYSYTSSTGKLAANSLTAIQTLMYNSMFKFFGVIAAVATLIFFYRRYKDRQIAHLNEQLLAEIDSAYIDPVTGRDNFIKFKILAEELLKTNSDKRYAIFYSDIKNFKYVNDAYGFEAGNRLLRHYSDWLESRKKLAFARVSADNFVSLEVYVDDDIIRKNCMEQIERFSDVSGIIEGLTSITILVGVYCTEDDNTLSLDAMIDRAMIAQRQLKRDQSSACMLYRESFRQEMIINQRMENRMESALKNGEFEVYLQPKISSEKNSVVSCEALVRWLAPEAGIISPAQFIPLFERNGFIKQLDLYMFRKVCAQIQEWIRAGYEVVPISVNISKVLLKTATFMQDYLAVKNDFDIPSGLLEVEFTESVLFDNSSLMQSVITFFRKNGILTAIDDFGAGYSSLNLLKMLPADILKLDRLFFVEDNYMEREHIILKNVISMAKELSMQIIAEGVENMEQVVFLKSIGCSIIQGYVFDKPLPIKEFERKYVIRENRKKP